MIVVKRNQDSSQRSQNREQTLMHICYARNLAYNCCTSRMTIATIAPAVAKSRQGSPDEDAELEGDSG
jgi:hypothetical protein